MLLSAKFSLKTNKITGQKGIKLQHKFTTFPPEKQGFSTGYYLIKTRFKKATNLCGSMERETMAEGMYQGSPARKRGGAVAKRLRGLCGTMSFAEHASANSQTVTHSPNIVPPPALYCPPPPTSLRSATSPSAQGAEGEAWMPGSQKIQYTFCAKCDILSSACAGMGRPGQKNRKNARILWAESPSTRRYRVKGDGAGRLEFLRFFVQAGTYERSL